METKTMYKELTPEKRVELMSSNACEVTKMNVPYEFTPDEMTDMRKVHTELVITLDEKGEKKKEYVKVFNAEIAPVKERAIKLRREIKAGRIDVEKTVYAFDNQHDNMMEYYDAEGNLVYERPLMPSEKQGRLRMMTGTDDK